MSLQLPQHRSTPAASLLDYTIFLYGREKIGKTTLASQFPDAIFLMCEPGGKSLSIFQLPVNNWKELMEIISLLEKDKGRFRTIVLDTVDLAFHFCQDYVCQKLAITHPSEEDFGKGWSAIRDEFMRAMVRLQKMNKGVVFISHAEEKEIRKAGGTSSDRVQPTLAKQGRKILEPMVDIWAYYTYTAQGGQELIIRGDADIAAGCRIKKHFVGVSRIPMGGDEEAAFRNLNAAFNQAVAPQRALPVKPGISLASNNGGSQLKLRRK